MKATLLVLGSGLLAATLAVAQDMPANSTEGTETNQNMQTTSQTHTTSNNSIRGCLSGSPGNYTLTDQNGTQYRVMGDDAGLEGKAGHEVEITTRENQDTQTTSQGDRSMQQTTNAVQVSNVRDVAGSCNSGNSMGSSPMNNDTTNPKGTPDAAEPPQPQTIAMLQQESKPDTGTNSPQQTTPPVTSQTPATPGTSTSSVQQQATAPATPGAEGSSTTTTTNTNNGQQGTMPSNTNGMTGSEVNQNAQGARQGEMNANPPAGNTAAGANNPGTSTSSSTTTTNTTTQQQPQANSNDQNKPLYERQATDIPWAKSGANSGNQTGTNAGTSNSNTGTNPPQ